MNKNYSMLIICAVVILGVCIMPTAMASAKAQNDMVNKDAAQLKMETFEKRIGEKGMKEATEYLRLQASLPKIVRESPYSYIAFAAMDKKSQDEYVKAIDESNLDEETKSQLINDLQDIWTRYPGKFSVNDNLVLSDVDSIMTERFIANINVESEEDNIINVRWTATPHRDFAKYACDGSAYESYAEDAGDDPDNSGFDPAAYRYYNHYEDAFWGVGGAPGRCDEFADSAIFAVNNGYQATAHQRFGYACHYLVDPGIPFHSKGATDYLGGFIDALFCAAIHTNYENHVYQQWNTGYEFGDYVSGNSQSITVTNPEDAVKDNADHSAQYYDYIKNEMQTNTNWKNDMMLNYYTAQCVQESARYSHGLYDYIM